MVDWDLDEQLPEGFDPVPKPLPVPLANVNDAPLRCIQFNDEYTKYMVRALTRLRYFDAWDGDNADVRHAHENIDHLIGLLETGDCPDEADIDQCWDFPLYAPNAVWEPMNPFREPEALPPGWNFPPWHVATISPPFLDLKAGDVYCTILDYQATFPPFLPVSGFPRVQFYVDGPGELDITLVRIPQGGCCTIFVDSEPYWVEATFSVGLLDLVNLPTWADLFGFSLNTAWFEQATVQVPVSGEGLHQIGIEFRPLFDAHTVFGFGGAIRAWQWCGSSVLVPGVDVITDIRYQDGILEKFVGGEWESVSPMVDVLDENDFNIDTCQIQVRDSETGNLVNIPGATFLHTLNHCLLQNWLEIQTTTQPQLRLSNPDNMTRFFQVSQSTSQANFLVYGLNYFRLRQMDIGTTIELHPSGFVNISDKNTGVTIANRFMSVRSAFRTPLAVAIDAAISTIQEWYDDSQRLVAELSREGWFSAIQQVIVNDWSSTGAKRAQGRLLGQWAESTDSTRRGKLTLQVDDYTGVHDVMQAEAGLIYPQVGFFGVPTVPRQAVEVDWSELSEAEYKALLGLNNLGLFDVNFGPPPVGSTWAWVFGPSLPADGLEDLDDASAPGCGVYSDGVGWFDDECGAFGSRISKQITLTGTPQINWFECFYTINNIDGVSNLDVDLRNGLDVTIATDLWPPGTTGDKILLWTGSPTSHALQCRFVASQLTVSTSFVLTRLVIAGVGTPPSFSSGLLLT